MNRHILTRIGYGLQHVTHLSIFSSDIDEDDVRLVHDQVDAESYLMVCHETEISVPSSVMRNSGISFLPDRISTFRHQLQAIFD